MRFCEIPRGYIRFDDVPVNQSIFTEANRGLTSYTLVPTMSLHSTAAWWAVVTRAGN
jgi:hypothetical protein